MCAGVAKLACLQGMQIDFLKLFDGEGDGICLHAAGASSFADDVFGAAGIHSKTSQRWNAEFTAEVVDESDSVLRLCRLLAGEAAGNDTIAVEGGGAMAIGGFEVRDVCLHARGGG